MERLEVIKGKGAIKKYMPYGNPRKMALSSILAILNSTTLNGCPHCGSDNVYAYFSPTPPMAAGKCGDCRGEFDPCTNTLPGHYRKQCEWRAEQEKKERRPAKSTKRTAKKTVAPKKEKPKTARKKTVGSKKQTRKKRVDDLDDILK